MKIADVSTTLLSRMHEPEWQWQINNFRAVKADAAIVTITTDQDVVGIGEASPYGYPTLIAEQVTKLAPEITGLDPQQALHLGLHPNGASLSYDCAVAAIDAALWDIRGKVEGKRVADLLKAEGALGSVRLYASGGCNYDWGNHPEALVEEVVGYQKEGFLACKVRIGTHWDWDNVTPARQIALLRDLRDAVGDDFELMLDGNCRLTEAEALAVGRGLDELHFTWFEEPIPKTDLAGYVRLNEAFDTPVTGGESWTTLEQFAPFLEVHAYSIAQPDVGTCGMTEAWRIVQAAARNGVDVCPHNWHNGLLTIIQANLVAALPHPHVLELCRHQGPLQWALLKDPPSIANGVLVLPSAPGYGVALATNLEEKYPYIEGDYRIDVYR